MGEAVTFRREFDDAKHRTMRWRWNADVPVTAVSAAGIVYRYRIGNPAQALSES
jgi:hypothetical protein